MKVLLVHDTTADALFGEALLEAGHDVVRCTASGRPTYPCDGLDGRCPLDGTVDVTVVVHDVPSTDIHPGEAGAVCALRDRVPLVLAGHGTAAHPFGDRPVAVASSVADVGNAVVRAARVRDRRLAEVADPEATVQVRAGCVRATLPDTATPADVVRAHRRLAAAAAAGTRAIDVAVVDARPYPD